ncbi:hypothetical protein [Brumicola blandensis]|uniref:Transposase n=1 Tax=Brumicola blandensis TaxID=3075611 RepID=A0AAW8R140_9ALTE|nr:hypothetical protein [Alteromonas sp. W409]MDT0581815.1 hypothetical protein [Alteromonas sp. W409]
MTNHRFKENREHRFTISKPTNNEPVLVVCPKCESKSSVVPHGEDKVRCTCFSCGYTSTKSSNGRTFYWYDENPTDGYFGFNLWLRIDCNGNSLWAFNQTHLQFLESYVGATLRERVEDDELGWSNSSLASRLPKWIKSAKNREPILNAISKLKSKL